MKKIGLICLALVLALGTLGVGYAMWSETVTIGTTVNTGEVSIGFSKTGALEPFGESDDKNVGSITSQLDGAILCQVLYTGVLVDVREKLVFLMSNAYPCYQTAVWADVANCGTIPVIITGVDKSMVEVDGSGALVETLTWVWDDDPPTYGHFEDSQGGHVLGMEIVNLVGEQLDPGGKDVIEFDLHVKQQAKQGAIYKITISITGSQWNEA